MKDVALSDWLLEFLDLSAFLEIGVFDDTTLPPAVEPRCLQRRGFLPIEDCKCKTESISIMYNLVCLDRVLRGLIRSSEVGSVFAKPLRSTSGPQALWDHNGFALYQSDPPLQDQTSCAPTPTASEARTGLILPCRAVFMIMDIFTMPYSIRGILAMREELQRCQVYFSRETCINA